MKNKIIGSVLIGIVVFSFLLGASGASNTEGTYEFLGLTYLVGAIWGGIILSKIEKTKNSAYALFATIAFIFLLVLAGIDDGGMYTILGLSMFATAIWAGINLIKLEEKLSTTE